MFDFPVFILRSLQTRVRKNRRPDRHAHDGGIYVVATDALIPRNCLVADAIASFLGGIEGHAGKGQVARPSAVVEYQNVPVLIFRDDQRGSCVIEQVK